MRLPKTINGIKASDIEARWAISAKRYKGEFVFQYQVPDLHRHVIDFVHVFPHKIQPVEIDGEFAHKTAAQKEKDRLRDALLNAFLAKQGFRPIIRVPYTKLRTQEMSDRTYREIMR